MADRRLFNERLAVRWAFQNVREGSVADGAEAGDGKDEDCCWGPLGGGGVEQSEQCFQLSSNK